MDVVENHYENTEKTGNETKAAEVLEKVIATKKVEESISNFLLEIGIRACIKGYHYLKIAIKLGIDYPTIVSSITKTLYPKVAEIYNETDKNIRDQRDKATSSKVERAIRHAIDACWSRGNADKINKMFKVEVFDIKYRPTNGEFIAVVTEKMLLKIFVEAEERMAEGY